MGQKYATTNATSYATGATVNPAARALIVAIVCATSTDTSEADPTQLVSSGSPQISFTKLSTTLFVSGLCTVTCWVADTGDAPAASQTFTVSGWGTSRTGCAMGLLQFEGADLSGGATAAVRNIVTNTGTGTSGSCTLAAASRPDNRPMALFAHDANEGVTQATSWTKDSGGSFTSPTLGSCTEYRPDTFDTAAAASWTTSAAWRGYALEIIAANPVIQPTIVRQAVNRAANY